MKRKYTIKLDTEIDINLEEWGLKEEFFDSLPKSHRRSIVIDEVLRRFGYDLFEVERVELKPPVKS